MTGRLLLASGAVLLSLLLGEGVLRAIGFSYHLYPQEIEFGAPSPQRIRNFFEADRDLFWVSRDYFDRLEEARGRRVALVFLGDSCTQFGTYPERFAERVGARHGSPPTWVELGVSGWSTHQGLAQLRRDVVPIAPRVATIYYGWNDHWVGFGVEDADVSWIHSSAWFRLLEASRLAQLFTRAGVAARGGRQERPLRVPPGDFRDNLTEMVRVAREHGIVPVLLTAPTSLERGSEPARLAQRHVRSLSDVVPLHARYVSLVREVAAAEDVVLCDLARDFEQVPRPRLRSEYFRRDGIHLRPSGDEYLAELLYGCFEANDLLGTLFDVARPPHGD